MRHAKSDWSDYNAQDRDRVLNERGIGDASMISAELAKRSVFFHLIISSPAQRAKSTAEIIAQNNRSAKLQVEDCFYFSDFNSVLKVINNIPDSFDSVLIVGHNPLWSKMVSDFAGSESHVFLDTADIVCLASESDSWALASKNLFTFKWLLSPEFLRKK